MRRTTHRKVVLALALALVLAGCAGDDDAASTTAEPEGDATTASPATTEAPDPGATTTAGAEAPAGEGVTVGVIVPLTGDLGAFGEVWSNAFELAANHVNATGLNSCGDISLVFADSGTDPEVAIREATRMIESDGAVAIVGPTSGEMVALADLAVSSQTVIGSEAAGTVELNEIGGNFLYRTVQSDLGDGTAAATWIVEQDYGSVATMAEVAESPLSATLVAAQAMEEAGINVVEQVEFNPGQPSYQAELSGVIHADPELIYLGAGQEAVVTIVREAVQLGYEGEWLLSADNAVPETIEAVGPDIMNDIAYTVVSSADTALPVFTEFAASYEEAFGEAPGPFASNAYDLMILVALAMVASDCTGAGINSQMQAVSRDGTEVTSFQAGAEALAAGDDIDYNGASGPVDFDDTGTVPGAYAIQQVQDGAWVDIQFYPSISFSD